MGVNKHEQGFGVFRSAVSCGGCGVCGNRKRYGADGVFLRDAGDV